MDERRETVPAVAETERWLLPSARNLAVAMVSTAEQSGQRFQRWDDVWASDREVPDPIANYAIALVPITTETAIALTSRLDAFFSVSGSPWILWSAWPTPDAESIGFRLVEQAAFMVRPAGIYTPVVPPELRIVEVVDDKGLAIFERILIDGFEAEHLQPARPGSLFRTGTLGGPLRFWIGYRDEEPVSVAAACVYAGVTGIYCVATLPHARGHGYGAAMTSVAASIDPTLPVVLQASKAGYPVYERLGFTEVAAYDLWMKQDAG